ncbi:MULTISPECIES: hypothetical protein [unclassified Mameliella]|uniref:hypothetical protein n=1 Tax=unclassified Mameliella TaxID=2630630 RepID=UPI00273D157F|nr:MULTISPECIES: hypothetical protein [unclassified Mameliella]
MKTQILTGAALALFTLPAFAQDMEGDVALDTDGDGMVSLEEVQVMYPDVSQDDYAQADADGDGLLSAEELDTARADGLIPANDA